jgi:hypothetical protein
MDHEWTGQFFQLHDPEWQEPADQRRTIHRVYGHFISIAQQVAPQQYATGEGWRTSRTKILDNALIGFCTLRMGSQGAAAATVRQVTFDVAGYPPIKTRPNQC